VYDTIIFSIFRVAQPSSQLRFCFCCCLFVVRQSLYIAQAGLELVIFLPQRPKCWNYRWEPSGLARIHFWVYFLFRFFSINFQEEIISHKKPLTSVTNQTQVPLEWPLSPCVWTNEMCWGSVVFQLTPWCGCYWWLVKRITSLRLFHHPTWQPATTQLRTLLVATFRET
jgi:hypothetical protein